MRYHIISYHIISYHIINSIILEFQPCENNLTIRNISFFLTEQLKNKIQKNLQRAFDKFYGQVTRLILIRLQLLDLTITLRLSHSERSEVSQAYQIWHPELVSGSLTDAF